MYHLYADIVGATNERGELNRASDPCGVFSVELPAGSCCQPFVPCAGPFARTKSVDRVVLRFGVAQRSASSQLFGSRLRGCTRSSLSEMQGAVLVVWFLVVLFLPRKNPFDFTRISLGELSLLHLLGEGQMSGRGCRMSEGRDILPCLQHLLPSTHGALAGKGLQS